MKNFSKNSKSGFTLIELLVVVAIIAILASVVITALGGARAKGGDSAIKSDLTSVRNQVALYYTTNSSFGSTVHAENSCASNATNNFLSDGIVKQALGHANTISGGSITSNRYDNTRCAISSTSYAVVVTLVSDNTDGWCIDSANNSKRTASSAGSAASITGSGSVADPYLCGN